MTKFMVVLLPEHFPGGNGENHERRSGWSVLRQGLELRTSKYKPDTLPLRSTYWVCRDQNFAQSTSSVDCLLQA